MTKLTYTTPSVGEKVTVAEPLVDTALAQIKTVVNGELDSTNLKAGGVAKEDLSTELKTELGSFVGLPLEAKKSIIATEQERESATYGTLSTPDEVEVTLGTNGLIAVAYQAQWSETVTEAARATIFIGANQLKVASLATGPALISEAAIGKSGENTILATNAAGIASAEKPALNYGPDVTTGQIVGGQALVNRIGNEPISNMGGGGPCWIFAAAGTYKISVKFKATSGKVKVKERKLWCWVIG